jgi:hypothetical protein
MEIKILKLCLDEYDKEFLVNEMRERLMQASIKGE